MRKFKRPSEVYLPPVPFTITQNLGFDPTYAQHARVLGLKVVDVVT